MSVFIRKDAKDGIYSYDFQFGGKRFSGSTGKTQKKAAAKIEEQILEKAKIDKAVEGALFGKELNLLSATARYWLEVGQHNKNSDNMMWSLGWLKDHFGEATMLHDIDDSKVATMVAKRRGEYVPNQRKKGRSYSKPYVPKLVTPATVNRTVTEPLREIILRAAKVWTVKVGKIDWSKHLLDEPQERIREATPREEAQIMKELERGYDVGVEFAFINGCRRMEIIGLVWSRVDFFTRRFSVIGKGDKQRWIPMTQRSFEILWNQQGHHPEYVFTYEAKRTVKMADGRLLERGKRYPLTEAGFKTAARRAIEGSGVKNFRFHDTRHTAATRVLRKSNLRVVQTLLGHSDIATTTKYAHAMMDDVLNALEAASPTENPTDASGSTTKRLKDLGKAG